MSRSKIRLRQYPLAIVAAFAMAGSVRMFAAVMALEVLIIELPGIYKHDEYPISDRSRNRRLDA